MLTAVCARKLDDVDSQLQHARNLNQGRIQGNLEWHQDLNDMGKRLLTDFDKTNDLCCKLEQMA